MRKMWKMCIRDSFPDGATGEYRLRIAQAAGGTMRPVVSGMAWVDLLPQDCDKGTALDVYKRQRPHRQVYIEMRQKRLEQLFDCGFCRHRWIDRQMVA